MQGTQTNGQQLLTARQVQGMLGIDRSTVYRMAEDGRLPALKIGRQWRFPPEQIERVLVIAGDEPGDSGDRVGIPAGIATAVISVAADLLGVMMVVTDMAGQPVTGVANPCPWFAARASVHQIRDVAGRHGAGRRPRSCGQRLHRALPAR